MEKEFDDSDDEETVNVCLFSPLYNKLCKDCIFCIYNSLPKYKQLFSQFENSLNQFQIKLGCCMKTCIDLAMKKHSDNESMSFITESPKSLLYSHFDPVFGDPLCGYNRAKEYDFFSLYDKSCIDNKAYTTFVYDTYKYSRSTSLCPYSLLAVLIFKVISSSIGEESEFKKKHDYLWMFNTLVNHNLRMGKLK